VSGRAGAPRPQAPPFALLLTSCLREINSRPIGIPPPMHPPHPHVTRRGPTPLLCFTRVRSREFVGLYTRCARSPLTKEHAHRGLEEGEGGRKDAHQTMTRTSSENNEMHTTSTHTHTCLTVHADGDGSVVRGVYRRLRRRWKCHQYRKAHGSRSNHRASAGGGCHFSKGANVVLCGKAARTSQSVSQSVYLVVSYIQRFIYICSEDHNRFDKRGCSCMTHPRFL